MRKLEQEIHDAGVSLHDVLRQRIYDNYGRGRPPDGRPQRIRGTRYQAWPPEPLRDLFAAIGFTATWFWAMFVLYEAGRRFL